MADLNPAQRDAVATLSGPLLVLALRTGRMREFTKTAVSALLVWVLVNLPVLVLFPRGIGCGLHDHVMGLCNQAGFVPQGISADLIATLAMLDPVLGGVEIEVGPVVEPWDLGVMPPPAEPPPGRFLLLCKGDPASESGSPAASVQRRGRGPTMLRMRRSRKARWTGLVLSSRPRRCQNSGPVGVLLVVSVRQR